MTNQTRSFKLGIGLAALSVLGTVLSGCAGSDETAESSMSPSNTAAPATAAAAPTAKAAEPARLKVILFEAVAGLSFDNFSTHYIEEKTNTKLDITAIPGAQLEEKLNIMLASGERPDVIMYASDSTEAKFVDSGLLLPINTYFDRAPNLKKYGEKGIWNAMTHADGNIYAVPNAGANGNVDNTPLIRKDWLDKLGLSVPTTVEEFYTVADALTHKDPDGNGKKDTFAIGGYTSSGQLQLQPYDQIFGAFGVLPGQWVQRGDKLVYSSVAPGMLEALKFMNRLFMNNVMDPEFVTDNGSRFKDKLLTGKLGTASYRQFIFDSLNINNYYKPFHESNPTGEMALGGVLKAATEHPVVGPRILTQRGWLKTSVLKESKNAEAAIRLIDYLSSEEGIRFNNYGVEGTDYSVENGVVKMKITDEQKNARGIGQIRLVFYPLYDHTSPEFRKAQAYAEEIAYRDPTDGLYVNNPNVTDLNKFASERVLQMITSTGSIDNMYADYVKEWNRRGGEEWTAQINEAYKARKK
ncbi:MAG: extracellular solute-binding protein family 1 [Paenibacillaceae bacterium]|nr:extracellular solute-binding protein family 1 [Paenibacillaceae bacterium]